MVFQFEVKRAESNRGQAANRLMRQIRDPFHAARRYVIQIDYTSSFKFRTIKGWVNGGKIQGPINIIAGNLRENTSPCTSSPFLFHLFTKILERNDGANQNEIVEMTFIGLIYVAFMRQDQRDAKPGLEPL